jgi:capsule polysaccharide modification protein KpsS
LRDVRCDKKLEGQPNYYLESREKALKAFEFRTMARNVCYEVIRRVYQRLRRYEKATGYLLKDNMLAHYRMWEQFRELMKFSQRKIGDIHDQSFIYFPLGVEPERSLTRDSPEFCHQHYAAQAVAKDLPAGTYLVIKEHLTAVGPRPKDFYKSLSMLSNVIMLDPLEPSLEIIKTAKAVATVTGTAGLEAAFMGVPVLSFGKHNIYRIIPHVHTLTSWLEIAKTVRSILGQFDEEREKREQDGSRFLQAMVDISVDCRDTDFNKPIAPAIMAEALHLLDATMKESPGSLVSE